MNRIIGGGLIAWMNLILISLVISANLSFLDVFRIERAFDTSLLIYSILIGFVMYLTIIMNIYYTRGMKKENKILFVVLSNGIPGYIYSVLFSSITGIIIITCYIISLIWILREKNDSRRGGKIWDVIIFGWNAQNKVTNLLMVGILFAGLYAVYHNPQPYINEFKNMSLRMVQIDTKDIISNETINKFLPTIERYIEESLPPIMNRSEIKEKILETNCGYNQTCREILLSYPKLNELVEQAYQKQFEEREILKKQAIETWKKQVLKQLEFQNAQTKELMEIMMTQIPIIRTILENIHWVVALTASAVIVIYGKLILGPIFVLLSLVFYKIVSQRSSWEELVEFIQMRFR